MTVSQMPVGPVESLLTDKVAIACGMMASNRGRVLGRVSIVNYDSKTVFDTFICYPEPMIVTDTREQLSGIRREDIDPENGAQPLEKVQDQVFQILYNRHVVGHGIDEDLRAISKRLPPHVQSRHTPDFSSLETRDTQKYSEYRKYTSAEAVELGQGPSIKDLARVILRREIRQGGISGAEDAAAIMQVYRHAEVFIDFDQARTLVY